MSITAVVILTDGTASEIDGDYESLKAALDGGWLEIAPTPGSPFMMFCDEEGKLKGLPFNERANTLANRYRSWEDPLAGNVVIVGPVDGDGEHGPFSLNDLVEVEG